MALFKAENLTFHYADVNQEKKALDEAALFDLSFEIQQGEFVLVCGRSGCGKTTLLRSLKPELMPYGKWDGRLSFDNEDVFQMKPQKSAFEIGFVMQNPENQIVTDKVWHELAFGLENMGLSQEEMHLRVAEMAQFFGIQEWFFKGTDELSGGQKQILNLASIMVMRPKVLILDEPTSQLDPIAAQSFLQTIKRIHEELGTTIILCEHAMDQVFAMADRVLYLEEGKMACFLDKEKAARYFLANQCDWLLPGATKLVRVLNGHERIDQRQNEHATMKYPFTVLEGRQLLLQNQELFLKRKQADLRLRGESEQSINGRCGHVKSFSDLTVLKSKNLWFSYERNGKDILKGVSISLRQGEIYALLGGNGSGKTTLLQLLAGLRKPVTGSVKVEKGLTVSLLGQDPQTLFTKNSVEKELADAFIWDTAIGKSLRDLKERHPYDLSGGEQQRLALAKVLLSNPDILLLDEPTKGLDGIYKQELAEILLSLKKEGKTILLVSHDVEFCAMYADRCGLLFDGELTTERQTKEFFLNNYFYTTIARRLSQQIVDQIVTMDELLGGE